MVTLNPKKVQNKKGKKIYLSHFDWVLSSTWERIESWRYHNLVKGYRIVKQDKILITSGNVFNIELATHLIIPLERKKTICKCIESISTWVYITWLTFLITIPTLTYNIYQKHSINQDLHRQMFVFRENRIVQLDVVSVTRLENNIKNRTQITEFTPLKKNQTIKSRFPRKRIATMKLETNRKRWIWGVFTWWEIRRRRRQRYRGVGYPFREGFHRS